MHTGNRNKKNIFLKVFQTVVMSVLLNGSTTWTPTQHLEKKVRQELSKDAASCFWQLQNNSCAATYLPSHTPLTQNEQDMSGTAGEVRTTS